MKLHKLKKDLHKVFTQAIEAVGLDNFKKTSFFGSNDSKKEPYPRIQMEYF